MPAMVMVVGEIINMSCEYDDLLKEIKLILLALLTLEC